MYISNSDLVPLGIIHIIWDYVKIIKYKRDEEHKSKFAKAGASHFVFFEKYGIVIGDSILLKGYV